MKERLSQLWLFALLNYLYADVRCLVRNSLAIQRTAPHLTEWALAGSAVLMEIPIAMILACRMLPFRANRLANIIAGVIRDPHKRFSDLRSASDRLGPAACSSRVFVFRDD